MSEWTHRRTDASDRLVATLASDRHILPSASDSLPVKKIKPGFHAELINNKNAAMWLEKTMTTDLAKLHLYNLNLEIKRLHGHDARFSPEICEKVHSLTSELDAVSELHDKVVSDALQYLFDKRGQDASPSVSPGPTPTAPAPGCQPPFSHPPLHPPLLSFPTVRRSSVILPLLVWTKKLSRHFSLSEFPLRECR